VAEDGWYTGNAGDDANTHRGWLLGNFIAPPDVRTTGAVEVKWGVHEAGEKRPDWSTDERRTTLVLLVEGRFRVDLSSGSAVLDRRGDYVVWGPAIDHSWQAEADSVVITVRWPSLV
jgi:quercetin dioxygenase-like cupin family protein